MLFLVFVLCAWFFYFSEVHSNDIMFFDVISGFSVYFISTYDTYFDLDVHCGQE